MNNVEVCDHGRLKRSCDTCALADSEAENARLKLDVAHYKALLAREKETHACTFALYHRYFVAQQQTQKGLHRAQKKIKRLKGGQR